MNSMPNVQIGDVKFHYRVEGKGPYLVLLHGHGGNLHLFDNLSNWLKKNYTVLRYDQRGYGLSDKPIELPYSTELWAKDLNVFLNKLDIQEATIGGHSMSGRICSIFAVNYTKSVKKLITFNTRWFGTNPIAAKNLESTANRVENEGMDLILETSKSFQSIPEKQKEVRKLIQKMILKNNPSSYANGSRAVALDFKGDSKEYILKKLECPALILIGDRDSAPLKGANTMFKRITNSKLAVIPGSGHYSILEKPQIVKSILCDFLFK